VGSNKQKLKKFAVGDRVEWTSQANGSATTKIGKVIEVVPAGTRVPATLKGMGWWNGREHDSYVVDVKGKPYWPRVAYLKMAR